MSDHEFTEQALEDARVEALQAAKRVELESKALAELSSNSAEILTQLQSRGTQRARTDAMKELNADLEEGAKRVRESTDEYNRRPMTYRDLFKIMQDHTGQKTTDDGIESDRAS